MTPIERAARAMHDAVQPEWDWNDPDAELLRQSYRKGACGTIAAIRERYEFVTQVSATVIVVVR